MTLPILGAVSAAHTDRLGLTAETPHGLNDEQALTSLDRRGQGQPEPAAPLPDRRARSAGRGCLHRGRSSSRSGRPNSPTLHRIAVSGVATSRRPTSLFSSRCRSTDNLTAVHLMSPFGRLATGLLLALLAVAPISAWMMTRSAALDARRATGLLALWCFFGAATYMTLANLQLVPFTGRNAYLLTPTSGAISWKAPSSSPSRSGDWPRLREAKR
ncbi:hypothetical protein ACRAWD_27380 [Caulobacter segnis]